MCFSAQVSFTASAVLAIIGFATIKQTKEPRLKLIALVPFLFAIQQFCEGMVWLHMNGTLTNPSTNIASQYGFLSFAWVIWPIYVPLALLAAENVFWKKMVCVACLALGAAVSYVSLHFLLNEPLSTTISGNRINYGVTNPYENILYGIAVMLPIFISSINKIWIFGILVLFSYLVAQFIYSVAFTSVWCFFAAGISIVLYFILRYARLSKTNKSAIMQ